MNDEVTRMNWGKDMITPVISTVGATVRAQVANLGEQLNQQITNPWLNKRLNEIRKRVEKRQALVTEQVENFRDRAEAFRAQAETAGKGALKVAIETKDRVLTEVDGLRGASPQEIKSKAQVLLISLNRELGSYSKTLKASLNKWLKGKRAATKKKSGAKKAKKSTKRESVH
jgi:hypothetical protein